MVARCNRDLCIHCAGCVGVCPVSAIDLREYRIEIDPKKCIDCGTCIKFCPVRALSLK